MIAIKREFEIQTPFFSIIIAFFLHCLIAILFRIFNDVGQQFVTFKTKINKAMRGFLLFFICCISCVCLSQPSLPKLDMEAQFKQLAGPPLNFNLGQVSSIKVIVEIATKKIHFIESKRYKFHYSYCVEVMGYSEDVTTFNNENYGNSRFRNYYLGNINYLPTTNTYFLDLSVFDQMPLNHLIAFVHLMQKNCYFGNELKLLLNTSYLLSLQPNLPSDIPILLPESLYGDQQVQEVSVGSTIGKLRIVPHLDSLRNCDPNEILVLHGTPSYFPNVKGILLDEFQTPLSHLVILGRNRHIPIIAKKDLFSDSTLLKLDGQWVAFNVQMNGYKLLPSAPDYKVTSNQPTKDLRRDTTVHALVPIQQFRLVGASAIGNKAANFGVLNVLQKEHTFQTPENAFAIPFYFYTVHVDQSGALPLINQLNELSLTDEDSIRFLLHEIREIIRHTPVDTSLVHAIENQLKTSSYHTFRFRSSTNAEDALGFSGAGLYTSKTVDLRDSTLSIERALKAVWASCWSFEAFQERRFFGLSDHQLAMGILVHRSFPNEGANGVIITKNVYRSGYPGISINVQLGDVSVVEPPTGVSCDQITIIRELTTFGFQRTIEYIGRSSLTNNTPVLSDEELYALEKAAETVKNHYWKTQPKVRQTYRTYDNFGLDIEFKFDGPNRELYFKQVRFYNVF
jgi:hypothetical protein